MPERTLRTIAYMDGDFWIESFRRLETEGFIDLRIVFAVLPALVSRSKDAFNNVRILSPSSLGEPELFGSSGEQDNEKSSLIALYRYLSEYDNIITGMAKRDNFTEKNKSHVSWRINHFKVIESISGLFRSEQPDVIFFSEVPHSFGSFILYLCAKYFKIRTLIMVMPMEMKGKIYVIEGIDETNRFVMDEYLKGKDHLPEVVQLSEELEKAMKKMKKSYNAAKPVYVKKYIETGKTKFISIRHLKRMKKRRKYGVDLKYNIFQRAIRRFKMIMWHRTLPKEYNSLCSEIDLTQKYIYFAMHYQPEQTSLPMAGVFENQFMTISVLSRNLPAGWKLYVKENPFQFLNMDPHQKEFKNKYFYESVARLPNVRLVPMKFNSFELIDNSIAVATLTGMTGWEAINRGKSVLSFGFSSYRYCDGVFNISTDSYLKDVLSLIEHNSIIPDDKKNRFYISLVNKHSSPGVVKDFEFEVYKIDHKVNENSWFNEIIKVI